MGDLQTTKTIEAYFDNVLDTWEEQTDLVDMVQYTEPDGGTMQTSGDSYWESVQQHSNIVEGVDLSGVTPTGIIEESVKISLGTMKNVWTSQLATDMRTQSFWEQKGKIDGKTQAQRLNTDIAAAVNSQGGIFYRSNANDGLEFMSEGQMIMNERQLPDSMRYFMFNDRTSGKFAQELGSRQTLQGRPEESWKTGQLGKNICGFDPYTGSFLPNITGGASPDTTVTGNQSFAPEAGTVTDATNTVTNIDYRYAEIVVAASAGYAVGDKIKFINGGVDVYALGLGDKTNTGQAMTFTIVAKADGTHITVFPKPIAADDAALSDHEKAYANIDTQISNAAVVERLNIDASAKTNIFWDKSAIKVVGGTLPVGLFQEFNAAKVITKSLSNGLPVYCMYEGDIADLSLRYRITAWTGVTVVNPSNCGVAVSY